MTMASEWDVAVVGGGLVGTSVAWGLARLGRRTVILDEGDDAVRPSRGNFALVWVQSKGIGMPEYAAWSRRSAELWPALADALRHDTGLDVAYQRPGGLMVALSDRELEAIAGLLRRLHNQQGMVPYDYEVVDRRRLEAMLPRIGPDVVGATYCPLDGHVNSLRLFRALHESTRAAGVAYRPLSEVRRIEPAGGGFRLETAGGEVRAATVVLAAGHGNARLAPMVGLAAPVRPQRGQIIVTEKVAPFLHYPLATIRQTDEGGVMVGDSLEEAGFDDHVGTGVLSAMADRAVRTFPFLGALNVVRTWAALRVMSPDGFPIYQQSESAPGAFLVTCHSGVTLAAVHALVLPPLIAAGQLSADLDVFAARRFDVPKAA